MARDESTDSALEELRAFGLTYPGAHTKSPWPGHLDLAVNDKTFAYLSVAGDPFKLSCKLPQSCDEALSLPFAVPTEYGLGKSGWVTARLPNGPVPVEMFKAWIDESYRAQAPKRLVASLPAAGDGGEQTPAAAAAKKRPAKQRAAQPSPARKRTAKRPAKKRPAKKAALQQRLARSPAAQRKPGKKRRARTARSG